MKVACIMMQKNESVLLEPWILYHGLIFGFENLFVYDNGSSMPECIKIFEKYKVLGVNVNTDYLTKEMFESKGRIFSKKINELDENDSYDFYFPLDCDEFVVVEESEGCISIDATAIFKELENYINSTFPLNISAAYDNNAVNKDCFYRSAGQRKTFFAKNSCLSLDLGFHEGKTKSGEKPIKTRISYVHYHYKPYDQYVFGAKQKLKGRIDSFDRDSLLKYSKEKNPGHHLVGALLNGEDAYYLSHYKRLIRNRESYYDLQLFSCVVGKLGLLFNIDYKNLLSAYEQDVSRWRGYIDSLIFRDGYVIAKGWLVSVFSADLSEVILSVNGNRFLSSSISRHQRLDVFRGVEFSDENAGLEICFKVDDKIQTLKNMEIKIHIENNGFNNIFSLNKGISIR